MVDGRWRRGGGRRRRKDGATTAVVLKTRTHQQGVVGKKKLICDAMWAPKTLPKSHRIIHLKIM